MHLPVSGYREVRRIDPAVDHHDAVFARIAVRAAGVEIFDHQQIVAGKTGRGGRKPGGRLDQDEIVPGVIAG